MQLEEGYRTLPQLNNNGFYQNVIHNSNVLVQKNSNKKYSRSSVQSNYVIFILSDNKLSHHKDRYLKVTNQQLPINIRNILWQLDQGSILKFKDNQNSRSQSPLNLSDSKQSSNNYLNRNYVKHKRPKKKKKLFQILGFSNLSPIKEPVKYGLVVQKIEPIFQETKNWAYFIQTKMGRQRKFIPKEDDLKVIYPLGTMKLRSLSRIHKDHSDKERNQLSESFRLNKLKSINKSKKPSPNASPHCSSDKNFSFVFDLFSKQSVQNNLFVLPQRHSTLRIKAFISKGNNSQLVKQILQRRWWWKLTDQADEDIQFLWSQKKNLKFHLKQSMSFEPFQLKQSTPLNQNIQDYLDRKISEFKLRGVKIYPDQNFVSCHNHLEGNHYVGNKKFLYQNMKKYYQEKNQNVFNNLPQTFHITSIDCQDFADFLKIQEIGPWIVKPGENSNRGQGIKIFSSVEAAQKYVQINLLSGEHTFIIQKYLHNTLLYKGRKFDLRCYMLVTSHNRKLKAYWYEEGYVRTCSQLWNLSDLSNQFMHLTNDAIQKYDEDYGRYEPANKLSFSELSEAIPESKFKKQILPQLEVVQILKKYISNQQLRQQKQVIVFWTIQEDCTILKQIYKLIFGFDFMIDSNFKVWLIEVNTNPCLETPCALLGHIIPLMLDHAFKIGLDPLFPPPLSMTSKKLVHLLDNYQIENKFKLIFDEENYQKTEIFL